MDLSGNWIAKICESIITRCRIYSLVTPIYSLAIEGQRMNMQVLYARVKTGINTIQIDAIDEGNSFFIMDNWESQYDSSSDTCNIYKTSASFKKTGNRELGTHSNGLQRYDLSHAFPTFMGCDAYSSGYYTVDRFYHKFSILFRSAFTSEQEINLAGFRDLLFWLPSWERDSKQRMMEEKYRGVGSVSYAPACISFRFCSDTDGGRIAIAMFGRRGAYIVKLFTTLLLCITGLIGLDNANFFLTYIFFVAIWQRQLETPARTYSINRILTS